MSLKGLPGTRWCERAGAVKALIQGWDSIQKVLDELATDEEQKLDTRNQAHRFLRKMDERETRESNRLIFPVQVRFGFNSGFKFRFSSG